LGDCNEFAIPIPVSTTDGNQSQYSIISGPPDSINMPAEVTYPTPFQGFGPNLSGEIFTLDFVAQFGLSGLAELPNGTYTIVFRRNQTGDLLTNCSDGTSTLNVTITRLPTIPSAGGDVTLDCSATSTMLTGNEIFVGTSNWSQISGPTVAGIDNPLAQSITITNLTLAGEYIFRYSVSGGPSMSCQALPDDLKITVSPGTIDTAAIITPTQVSCQDTNFQLSANDPGGFTFVDDTSPTSDVTFTISGTYVFDWTVSGETCGEATDQVTLDVGIPTTVANAGPDQNRCNFTTVTLAGNAGTAVETGFWSVLSGAPNTPNIANVNAPGTSVSNLVTGTYTFRWTIFGSATCPSSFDDVEIEVAAPANAGPDQQFCQATNALLEGTRGSSGTWTQLSTTGANAVITTTGPNTANATITPGTAYEFQYEPDDVTFNSGAPATCDPGVDTVIIGSIASPPIPDAGPDQVKCMDDAPVNLIQLNGSDPSGIPAPTVNGQWEVVFPVGGGGASFDDDTLPNAMLTLPAPGLYVVEWTYTRLACVKLTDVMRINAYEPPSNAIAGTPQPNACQLDYVTDATAPMIGIGTRTITDAPGGLPTTTTIDSPNNHITALSGIQVGTYELTWTVSNGSGFPDSPSVCDTKVDTVSITFPDVPPSPAEAGPDQEICVDEVTMDATALIDGVGTWTQMSGPNTAIILSPNSESSLITNLVMGTYEFVWTVTSGGCTLDDMVEVIVSQQPITADAGPDQIVPASNPTNLNAVAAAPDVGVWTQISGPTTANFADSNLETTVVTSLSIGVYEFQWTIDNTICNEVSDTVIIEIIGISDLELSKTATPTAVNVNVGDMVTFEISVFNNGADIRNTDATGVSVFDVIPNGYDLVPGTVSNGGTYNVGNKSILWTNQNIANNTTLMLTYDVIVNATGPYVNNAQIIASDQFDPDSDPNTDNTVDEDGLDTDGDGFGDDDDDEDTAAVSLQSADLSLTKTVAPTTASIGDSVVFTVEVSNAGPDNATNVAVVDQLPAGYSYQSDNSGGNYAPGSGLWTVGTINSSASQRIEITALVNAPTGAAADYNNTAEVTASDQSDLNSVCGIFLYCYL